MRRFLTFALGACLAGTLAAQQPQTSTAGGTLWISAGEPARLIVNAETVGLVDRLRVLSVPVGAHIVRVESLRESDASLEQTVVVSSDQPVPVTFNLGSGSSNCGRPGHSPLARTGMSAPPRVSPGSA